MENVYADITACTAYEHDCVKLELSDFQLLLRKNIHNFRPACLRCFLLRCCFCIISFFPLAKHYLAPTSNLFHDVKFIEN